MNRKLIRTLAIVCLILMLIISLEWMYAERAQKKLLSPTASLAKIIPPEEMPTIKLNAQTEVSYDDLVNRPLFMADRKPVAETEQSQGQSTATGNNNANFDWMLNGIYTTKKGLMALLTRTVAKIPAPSPNPTAGNPSTDKYRKVVVGDNIDGWKVAEINRNEIIFMQGTTQKNLQLRKSKAKGTQNQISVKSDAMRIHTPASAPPAESQ
jgi:hypothetical protein